MTTFVLAFKFFFSFLFQLNIRINELENKRQFKCIYVNSRLKEEVSGISTLFQINGIFHKASHNKVIIVHCIY